jgi:hypothetical protein
MAALFLSLVGCGPESQADKMYRQATEMIDRGEYGPAVSILDEVIRRYPGTEAARLAREDVKLYRGLAGAVSRYPGQQARDVMTRTARVLEKHRVKYGRLPKKLTDIMPQEPVDPWGNKLEYEVSDDRKRYVLKSHGADGLPGGEGGDIDLVIRNGEFVVAPEEVTR